MKDGGGLQGRVGWTVDKVRGAAAAADDGAFREDASAALLSVLAGVEVVGETGVSRVEYFKEVQLAAAGGPAGAGGVSVLEGSWDLGVEEPYGGHIVVVGGGGGGGVVGH